MGGAILLGDLLAIDRIRIDNADKVYIRHMAVFLRMKFSKISHTDDTNLQSIHENSYLSEESFVTGMDQSHLLAKDRYRIVICQANHFRLIEDQRFSGLYCQNTHVRVAHGFNGLDAHRWNIETKVLVGLAHLY